MTTLDLPKAYDPQDARSVTLSLCKAGRALWNRIRRQDRELLRRIAAQLDQREVSAATVTLRKVRHALKSSREETP